jgi:hypothetical protein
MRAAQTTPASPTSTARPSLCAAPGSGSVIRFKIRLCCDYGPNHRGLGDWHECTIPADRYDAFLKGLCDDPTVAAFECVRPNSMFGPKSPAERAAPEGPVISWKNYEAVGGYCQHVHFGQNAQQMEPLGWVAWLVVGPPPLRFGAPRGCGANAST